MKQINFSEPFSTITELIHQRQNFEVCDIDLVDLFSFSQELEKYIESLNLKCRLYTKNRLATGLSAVLNPRWGILTECIVPGSKDANEQKKLLEHFSSQEILDLSGLKHIVNLQNNALTLDKFDMDIR